jgi:hypothetical protein
MGLEGIVSKRRDCAYTPGKCRHWVKTKNPAHPAYSRVMDQLLVTRSRKSRAKPKAKSLRGRWFRAWWLVWHWGAPRQSRFVSIALCTTTIV